MASRVVTFAVFGVLIVVAGILVGVTVRGERAKAVEAEVEAVTPGVSAEEGEVVACAVCGSRHPKDEMCLLAVESLGSAPDSAPVWVCSEECAEKVRENPEKYRGPAAGERQ